MRDNVIDADAQTLGEHIRRETDQYEHDQSAEKRQTAQLIRTAESNGVPIPSFILDPDRQLQGVRKEAEFWQEQRALDDSCQGEEAPKIYVLHPSPVTEPTPRAYWSLWAKVEKAKPGLNRHALTQKAIGCHATPQSMTPDQLKKMIDVFAAILRDAQVSAP